VAASEAPPAPDSSRFTAPRASPSKSSQPLVGIIVGAAGVVAIGVGSVFGAVALSKKGDADDRCDGSSCADARGVALNGEAQDAATLANVFVIGGAALAVTGVVLYLTAPTQEQAPSARVALRPSGVSLEGAF